MNPLPLRLTPFEQSLWVDDCPAYPWNILFRLRFAGRLDRAAFERALLVVVERHPFLSARVRRRWTRRTWWEPIPTAACETTSRVHWNEHEFGTWPTTPKLRLEAGESLAVWVHSGDAESEVLFHFHHVAADGAAAVRVIDELLQAYAAVVAGRSPNLPPLDSSRLKHRGRYGFSFFGLLRIAPKLWYGLAGIRQFLQRRPMPLVPHESAPREQPTPASYPVLSSHAFTQTETAALRERARRDGATLNDLLARDLFLTLHAWRQRRGATDDAWLRLLVPMDLRTSADAALPAADVMSTIFLDRRPSDCVDAVDLLSTLHAEMTKIKENHLGLIYVLMLRLTDIVPGLMEWLARRQKFTCSAIFSNLVRPLENSSLLRAADGSLLVGESRLLSFEFFPPVRPYTVAAFGIATYNGRLTLSLNADPRFLSPAEADELLAEYTARVATSRGSSTAEMPLNSALHGAAHALPRSA